MRESIEGFVKSVTVVVSLNCRWTLDILIVYLLKKIRNEAATYTNKGYKDRTTEHKDESLQGRQTNEQITERLSVNRWCFADPS